MILGISEVARMLGVCEKTVRRMADLGIIPSERTGGGWRLFDKETVEEFIKKREEQSPACH